MIHIINPNFGENRLMKEDMTDIEKIDALCYDQKNMPYAQYENVKEYMKSLGVDKPIHIGETGWASVSTGYYGPEGSKACDEYKEATILQAYERLDQ